MEILPPPAEPEPEIKYEWETLLSQQIVKLMQGTDYTCESRSIISYLRKEAKQRGLAIRAAIHYTAPETVVFVAYDPSQPKPALPQPGEQDKPEHMLCRTCREPLNGRTYARGYCDKDYVEP